jgi:hypothetical protein
MELYIQIKDGKPFEHPILGDNFRQAFPNIDTENLPPEFARFVRVAPSVVGVFEVYVDCTYELVDGVCTDIHNIRAMTAEEKSAKIANARTNLPANWTLNEETLQASPPPRPTVRGEYPYQLDQETGQWIMSSIPPMPSWIPSADGLRYMPPVKKPQDGSKYRWDEPTLSWIKLDV